MISIKSDSIVSPIVRTHHDSLLQPAHTRAESTGSTASVPPTPIAHGLLPTLPPPSSTNKALPQTTPTLGGARSASVIAVHDDRDAHSAPFKLTPPPVPVRLDFDAVDVSATEP